MRALVNNAAIESNAPIETFAIDEWRRMFEVNLFGHVAVIQALLPALIRNKGRVVNISSVGGTVAMATAGDWPVCRSHKYQTPAAASCQKMNHWRRRLVNWVSDQRDCGLGKGIICGQKRDWFPHFRRIIDRASVTGSGTDSVTNGKGTIVMSVWTD
jgi:hypothetical protein